MQPVFVLVHSPSVGPLTWTPVADRLRSHGYESVVPSLVDVADAEPPFWPRVVEDVAAAQTDSGSTGQCYSWRTATPACSSLCLSRGRLGR
jgi:hypothetical protein